MAIAMQGVLQWAQNAGADLTGKLFCFATLDANGNIVVATAAVAAIGAIIEEATSGNPASVQLNGIAKVNAGGTIVPGARVQTDSNGNAVTYSSGPAVGIYMGQGNSASGQVIPVLLLN